MHAWSTLKNFIKSQWVSRRLIRAATTAELKKRYAGSLLGGLWLIIFPVMFLSAYIFVWVVIFPGNLPGLTGISYVAFVFTGLVPFLFVMDVANIATISIRQNLYLIKGLIVAADQLPTRAVCFALVSHLVGVGLLLVLAAISGVLSVWILLLPVVILLTVVLLLGLAWFLAPLGLLVPDTSYLVSIGLTMLVFLSPIAFTPGMVPTFAKFVVFFNPITYIIEAYRFAVFGPEYVSVWRLAVFVLLTSGSFISGGLFCARLKDYLVDFE